MKCQKCGNEMVLLLVTAVCDHCEKKQAPADDDNLWWLWTNAYGSLYYSRELRHFVGTTGRVSRGLLVSGTPHPKAQGGYYWVDFEQCPGDPVFQVLAGPKSYEDWRKEGYE